MPQRHQLEIVLGKHLSGQVDRYLDLLEEGQNANTDRLNKALDRLEKTTGNLKDTVDQNKPQG